MKKIILYSIFITLSFTQVRVSFEFNGRFENDFTRPGIALGYDHIIFKGQDNITGGVGIEMMLPHHGYREAPDGMEFNSFYAKFNYAFTEKWNAYSKIGFSQVNDSDDFFKDDCGFDIGFGVFKNFGDYNIEFGYHVSYVDEYSYERFALSFVRSLKDEDK